MDNRIRARQRRAQRKGDAEHKLARSCRSIGEAASLALAACDEWQGLELINVVDVVPEPGSGRVLVLLAPTRPLTTSESESIEAALERVRSYVRREVAEALQRKRAFDVGLVLLPLPLKAPGQP